MTSIFRVPICTPTCSPSSLRAKKTRNFTTFCSISLPPVDPNDPFISRLASVALNSPEKLTPATSADCPLPYLDVFDSPKLMAAPAHVASDSGYIGRGRKRPPPDLPSILLDGRIVYIGMPLVPAVTELIIAELLYLQWMDDQKPIYIYINSTGTSRDDGEPVAMESEGFAIYSVLMDLMQCEIYTLAVGAAVGQACLLLAAGTKGKRFMMPNSQVMMQQPRTPPSGLMPARSILHHAREVKYNLNLLIKLFAKHTGKSVKEVTAMMNRGPCYMDRTKAREFGVVDKILWPRRNEKIMDDVMSREDWERAKAAGKNRR